MNDQTVDFLTPDEETILAELAEIENARLEEAASAVTHQAFNLGCFVGLLPGGIFVLVTFLLTGFSLIGAAIALVLILVGLIAFANLAAMLARRNTIRRVYRDESSGEIERALEAANLSRDQFDQVARRVLPPQAALYSFLPAPPPPAFETEESVPSDERIK